MTLDSKLLMRSLSEHERELHGVEAPVDIPDDCLADVKARYDIHVPEPHPNCVEYVLEDGRRFAWSESNVRYEEVAEDGASFTLLRRRLTEAQMNLTDMGATFDIRWNADMRAIKRWQEAHPGNELVWPDHADMVVWLMEQLDAR